ncbi:hypothetical protein QBC46DRAFT_336471 [Diplogelasinospora grovesii]|uniref:Uncharacterized protein n=1 Tax=Diplogelasinospora grovesii TaxID=303347 RepID=A0AAN6NIG3_9PEZI|nr:hypothetical protein QBC46DRAFT_336471 [Diplogelasinospora grovesii]
MILTAFPSFVGQETRTAQATPRKKISRDQYQELAGFLVGRNFPTATEEDDSDSDSGVEFESSMGGQREGKPIQRQTQETAEDDEDPRNDFSSSLRVRTFLNTLLLDHDALEHNCDGELVHAKQPKSVRFASGGVSDWQELSGEPDNDFPDPNSDPDSDYHMGEDVEIAWQDLPLVRKKVPARKTRFTPTAKPSYRKFPYEAEGKEYPSGELTVLWPSPSSAKSTPSSSPTKSRSLTPSRSSYSCSSSSSLFSLSTASATSAGPNWLAAIPMIDSFIRDCILDCPWGETLNQFTITDDFEAMKRAMDTSDEDSDSMTQNKEAVYKLVDLSYKLHILRRMNKWFKAKHLRTVGHTMLPGFAYGTIGSLLRELVGRKVGLGVKFSFAPDTPAYKRIKKCLCETGMGELIGAAVILTEEIARARYVALDLKDLLLTQIMAGEPAYWAVHPGKIDALIKALDAIKDSIEAFREVVERDKKYLEEAEAFKIEMGEVNQDNIDEWKMRVEVAHMEARALQERYAGYMEMGKNLEAARCRSTSDNI